MNFSGADRTRQLITVGVGTLLLLVMGGVLIAGFRLATQMNAKKRKRVKLRKGDPPQLYYRRARSAVMVGYSLPKWLAAK